MLSPLRSPLRSPRYSHRPSHSLWSRFRPGFLLLVLCIIGGAMFLAAMGWFRVEGGNAMVDKDSDAFLVRLNLLPSGMPGSDGRGWIANPLHAAKLAGLIDESQAGPLSCVDVHAGAMKPGSTRANHRHAAKNEVFLVWGARAQWRVENARLPRGYAQVTLEKDDVASMWAGVGNAHALTNIDRREELRLIVCADAEWDPSNPSTDYGVWKDLKEKNF